MQKFLKSINQSAHPFFILHLALICCLGFYVYSNSLSNGFSLMDDYGLIHNNKTVIKNCGIQKILSETLPGFKQYYRPLQTFSYKLDYRFWGLNPFGYHLTSVLFHLINACLLYIFLFLLFQKTTGPFFASLFFVCHPAFSEPVNYIASRSDLLAGTFFLLTSIFYLLRQKEEQKIFTALSCTTLILAFFSKEISFVFPFFLLFLERAAQKKYIRVLPYFILTLAFFLFRSFIITFKFYKMPSIQFFLTLPKVFFLYLTAFLLPLNLPKKWGLHQVSSIFDKDFLLPAIVLFLFLYAILKIYKRSKISSLGLAWFLLTTLTLALILSQSWPDMVVPFSYAWLYIPSIGLFQVLAHIIEKISKYHQWKKIILKIVCTAILLLALTTIVANQRWNNPTYINFEKTILNELPKNISLSILATNKGEKFLKEKKIKEASEEFQKALALFAANYKAINNMAAILLAHKKFDQAFFFLKEAQNLKPDNANIHYNLGLAYLGQNDILKAESEFEKTIKIDSNNFDAHYNLLILYARKNMEQKALQELSTLKYLDPSFKITDSDTKE